MKTNRNLVVILGVIVILIATACTTPEQAMGGTEMAQPTFTPIPSPLPVPSGCAKQVIDLPVDESLEWQQGGGLFTMCGITIKIEFDGMLDSTYVSFQEGEFIKKQLNSMTKVVFSDGTIYYLYKPDRSNSLMVAAVAAPPTLPVSTGCAVQVQSLDIDDENLNWIPSGKGFSACDISIDYGTGYNTWEYAFQKNDPQRVGNYMLKITFSDGVIIYAKWVEDLYLAGEPAP